MPVLRQELARAWVTAVRATAKDGLDHSPFSSALAKSGIPRAQSLIDAMHDIGAVFRSKNWCFGAFAEWFCVATKPSCTRGLNPRRTFQVAHPSAPSPPSNSQSSTRPNPASLLNRIIKEAADVDVVLAAQAPLSSALAQIAARATLFALHFNQVLDLGIIRGTYAAVQTALGHIVRGEAQRSTAEGSAYIPMALPIAAECEDIFTQFQSALRNNTDAQQNTDTQREQLQALYTEAQALAVDLCDTVVFHYRHDRDPGSFRTKCRHWGVVYIYDANEPRDPDDTTGPGTGGLPPVTPPPPSPYRTAGSSADCADSRRLLKGTACGICENLRNLRTTPSPMKPPGANEREIATAARHTQSSFRPGVAST